MPLEDANEVDLGGVQELLDELTRDVWHTEDDKCPLKVLQAVRLLSQYKERHNTTGPALKDLLLMIQALLPPNSLPRTPYLLKKVSNRVVDAIMGGPGFRKFDLCSNPECTHLYTDDTETECPKNGCGKPRRSRLENGEEEPIRSLRYMGIETGVRNLLASTHVCRALHTFPLKEMCESEYSLFSSELASHLCQEFIPGYKEMDPGQQATAALRFFDTGQVCSDQEWQQYQLEVQQGVRQRTKLLLLEGGTDGFQPYNRRQWTTWMLGYRLVNMNWRQEGAGQGEIVTAISEAAVEGKAVHVVAQLDAKQLVNLAPPPASSREQGLLEPLQMSSVDMFVPEEEGDDMTVVKVGVWVLCVGFQADAPMRQALIRGLAPAAALGCDECGIVGVKGTWNAIKYLGYCRPCDHNVRDPKTGLYSFKLYRDAVSTGGNPSLVFAQYWAVQSQYETAHILRYALHVYCA